MSTGQVNVDQWKDLFRFIGIEESDMRRWHSEFERRHPHGHQSFLEWLTLPPKRVDEIREQARKS